jgi:hypothetical protein
MVIQLLFLGIWQAFLRSSTPRSGLFKLDFATVVLMALQTGTPQMFAGIR